MAELGLGYEDLAALHPGLGPELDRPAQTRMPVREDQHRGLETATLEIHDQARSVGAALQAKGLVPGDHVAILGPTSRELMTIVRGCWMAGLASMVLPLPMRMGSLDAFIESTRAVLLATSRTWLSWGLM